MLFARSLLSIKISEHQNGAPCQEQCSRCGQVISKLHGRRPAMTATQSAPRTARERARAELTREIKEGARRQLAATGADGISLRAVARELGMASSAVYRYFPSRDDLLTALIIDAYDALGAAVESADSGQPRSDLRGRWR